MRSPEDSAARRTVLKIPPAEGDFSRGDFYSIDRPYLAFPAYLAFSAIITLRGNVVKVSMPGIGVVYEGNLSADRNTIVGTIKRGFPAPVTWTLKRVTRGEQEWAIPKPPTPAKPMAADIDPVFEVATVKLSPPGAQVRGVRVQPGAVSTLNMTPAELLAVLYDVHPHQIVGAPAWFSSEKYDITGKTEAGGRPSQEQWQAMVRKLLADRFRLAFHRELRELPVYALSVAKGGAKISRTNSKNERPAIMGRGPGNWLFNFTSMSDFCKLLQGLLDRPVVDRTGLAGRYDFTLTSTPDALPAKNPGPNALTPAAADPPPELFTATRQQLGLTIKATKLPTEVLVIDRVEKASEN